MILDYFLILGLFVGDDTALLTALSTDVIVISGIKRMNEKIEDPKIYQVKYF